MNNKVFLDFLQTQRHSRFITKRPNMALIGQKLSIGHSQSPSNTNQNKTNASKEFTIDMCKQFLYCHQLLNPKSPTKTRKQWQPNLTAEEKSLFDNEELLSAYQNIIANANGQHRHQPQMKVLQKRASSKPTRLPIHRYCRRGFYPGTSIKRQQTQDDQVPWTIDLPDYDPPCYTKPSLLHDTENIDPDKVVSHFMWNTFDTNNNVDRRTANPAGAYLIDDKGYPLNPLGRTGLCGRGELRRWAVNYQTHLVIMCGTKKMKSGKEIFKYIMEKPKDNHYYRLPSAWTTGSDMNAITKTLQTFLCNIYQTWNNVDHVDEKKINEIIKHLTFVSTAYIDDTKNTDNAWLETSVCCYIQTSINENIASNPHLDLNDLFPDPSLHDKTTFTWHQFTRTSKLQDSERDVMALISKRYNGYW